MWAAVIVIGVRSGNWPGPPGAADPAEGIWRVSGGPPAKATERAGWRNRARQRAGGTASPWACSEPRVGCGPRASSQAASASQGSEGSQRGLGPPRSGKSRVVGQAVHASIWALLILPFTLLSLHTPVLPCRSSASPSPLQPEGPPVRGHLPRDVLKRGPRPCIACAPGGLILPGIQKATNKCVATTAYNLYLTPAVCQAVPGILWGHKCIDTSHRQRRKGHRGWGWGHRKFQNSVT